MGLLSSGRAGIDWNLGVAVGAWLCWWRHAVEADRRTSEALLETLRACCDDAATIRLVFCAARLTIAPSSAFVRGALLTSLRERRRNRNWRSARRRRGACAGGIIYGTKQVPYVSPLKMYLQTPFRISVAFHVHARRARASGHEHARKPSDARKQPSKRRRRSMHHAPSTPRLAQLPLHGGRPRAHG